MGDPENEGDGLWLVYDGDCPLCRSAAQAIRVRAAVGQLHILNAREAVDHPLMRKIGALGLDLNEGIVVKYQGQFYHGAEALHLLALLGSAHNGFNRFVVWMFASQGRTRFIYPLLKMGRNLLLWVRGKKSL
ncbi:DCC1-like thiol-disulfide oxidoreductase family protein [Asticcacaulis tiandongensis]|uniref:DCC1-like thiol-disulfide oxidoreductase family protein n=1 Tax=Asticcacaulis tiandongensis TaxID=2565365 RepID=UPI00112D6FA5|nr:DCC1-like thiol-disulfide oxidoreductase family protein [Asticcacaulis tiandongensis]